MKFLISILLILCYSMANSGGNIILVPFDDYLGEIEEKEVCDFSYASGTILQSGTRLTIEPTYLEQYGSGSYIPVGSGMNCGTCAVHEIEFHGDSGITEIKCDILK